MALAGVRPAGGDGRAGPGNLFRGAFPGRPFVAEAGPAGEKPGRSTSRLSLLARGWPPTFPPCPRVPPRTGPKPQQPGGSAGGAGEAGRGGGAVPQGSRIDEKLAIEFPAVPATVETGPEPQQPGDSAGGPGEAGRGGGAVPQGAGDPGEAGRRIPRRARLSPRCWPSHNSLGYLLANLGRGAEAEEQYRQALVIQEKLAAEFPAVPEYGRIPGQEPQQPGVLLAGSGKSAEAQEHYKRALVIRES